MITIATILIGVCFIGLVLCAIAAISRVNNTDADQ